DRPPACPARARACRGWGGAPQFGAAVAPPRVPGRSVACCGYRDRGLDRPHVTRAGTRTRRARGCRTGGRCPGHCDDRPRAGPRHRARSCSRNAEVCMDCRSSLRWAAIAGALACLAAATASASGAPESRLVEVRSAFEPAGAAEPSAPCELSLEVSRELCGVFVATVGAAFARDQLDDARFSSPALAFAA